MDDNSSRSILDGDEVLVRQYFDPIETLPIRSKLFVIVTEGGGVIKQIKNINKEKRYITLHSFNPDWEDYDVYLDDILQIFTVEKKVKSKIIF